MKLVKVKTKDAMVTFEDYEAELRKMVARMRWDGATWRAILTQMKRAAKDKGQLARLADIQKLVERILSDTEGLFQKVHSK